MTESPTQAHSPIENCTTFDHAAFNCTGRVEYERKLTNRGINFEVAHVPQQSDQLQLFFRDPAGDGVELTFQNAGA